MRALTVMPRVAGSVRLERVPEPTPEEGAVLVRTLAVGICGTDREIIAGHSGSAPPGQERLILGHESIGRVEAAAASTDLAAGDLVVGIVRHPDPIPCASCALGEWDMCRNGLYTEHGIKERSGFCAEYFRADAAFLVRVAPQLGLLAVLVEPASVLAKAWDHIESIGRRAHWAPRRVLVTGAGPVGLLGALMGRQRGLDVDVFDRVIEGPKPQLVRAIGASYHCGSLSELMRASPPDIVLECTGAASVVLDVMSGSARAGIVCLIGVSHGRREIPVDMGELNRVIVLENDVVFGSVNANRRHYELAAQALCAAPREWLAGLISRRVPLGEWREVLQPRADDVKVVLDCET